MRIKVALIFIISILLPTVLLAYFGLQAVRSERSIVERSAKDRYEAMADVIETKKDATDAMSPTERPCARAAEMPAVYAANTCW